jgi:hypothetical protein
MISFWIRFKCRSRSKTFHGVFWGLKRVLDRGQEQRESKMTALYPLIITILISSIIICYIIIKLLIMENRPSQKRKWNSYSWCFGQMPAFFIWIPPMGQPIALFMTALNWRNETNLSFFLFDNGNIFVIPYVKQLLLPLCLFLKCYDRLTSTICDIRVKRKILVINKTKQFNISLKL